MLQMANWIPIASKLSRHKLCGCCHRSCHGTQEHITTENGTVQGHNKLNAIIYILMFMFTIFIALNVQKNYAVNLFAVKCSRPTLFPIPGLNGSWAESCTRSIIESRNVACSHLWFLLPSQHPPGHLFGRISWHCDNKGGREIQTYHWRHGPKHCWWWILGRSSLSLAKEIVLWIGMVYFLHYSTSFVSKRPRSSLQGFSSSHLANA